MKDPKRSNLGPISLSLSDIYLFSRSEQDFQEIDFDLKGITDLEKVNTRTYVAGHVQLTES